MGCSGSKENTLDRPGGAGSGKLTVWGDYFNSETRTVLAILSIAGVPHSLEEIDQFRGDLKKESYLAMNPSGQIPMISEGMFKILGGSNTLMAYLCNSQQRIKDKLYHQENRQEIEKHLAWFQSRMKPTSTRLIKMIVNPKAFGDKAPSAQELQRETEEFFRKLLPSLDKQVENKRFFCGDDITIADIQYYCEISTILNLTKKDLDEAQYPSLSQWYTQRCSVLPEIINSDKKLREIIAKYNLQ